MAHLPVGASVIILLLLHFHRLSAIPGHWLSVCAAGPILTVLDIGEDWRLAVIGRRKAWARCLSWVEKMGNPGHGPSGLYHWSEDEESSVLNRVTSQLMSLLMMPLVPGGETSNTIIQHCSSQQKILASDLILSDAKTFPCWFYIKSHNTPHLLDRYAYRRTI